MLLRQFISASNAIEEIYIVKREHGDSDDDENPPVDKLVPETGSVPESVMMVAAAPAVVAVDAQTLAEPVEIKSEPEDDGGADDDGVMVVEVEADSGAPNALLSVKREKVVEDFDDVPLAVRLRRIKEAKIAGRKKRKIRKPARFQESDSANDTARVEEDEDDDKYTDCNICTIKFLTRHELNNHLKRKHSAMLPFRCTTCVSRELKSVWSLNKHFEQHDASKPQQCCYCEARFSSRVHRTAHQRRFHKDDLENDTIRNANRRFVCRYCNKKFAAKYNMERHERNHEMKITDDDEFLNRRNKCYLCETKPFDSVASLIDHLSVHVDQIPYTCQKCEPMPPIIITSVRLLNKHLASHEEPEKPIKCVYCSERFISVVTCQAHERTHTEEKQADEVAVAKMESERISAKIVIIDGMKRYQCSFCENSYSLLSTLRRHENIHTGKIQYVCKVCFKSFRIKPLLKEHSLQCIPPEELAETKCRYCEWSFNSYREMLSHTAQNHPVIEETKCEFCDLSFKSGAQLVDHETNHRNPSSIRCKICNRIFKQLSNLRRHERLHSNDAVPYTCDLCGKNFSQSGALKVHKRIHSGDKPYKCELCSKTFYHSSTMNRHKRSHYKSKSKLFLFGDLNPSQAQEPTDLDPNMLVSPLEQALTPQISILNSSELVTIPVSVEAHHFIDPQVPTDNMQQQQEQQLPLASFEITAAGTLSGGVTATLADGTPLYVLDSKLLIPQTIMQHQQEKEGSPPVEMVLGAEMQQQQQLP
ncbi:zinc finger protein 558 [Culex quinquefasciatus]|uniref:Zinc finger protein 558 n=1 Tax=Culex quinquefasciatus TaxID=7176 RepID=B0W1W8_CULQU|nr:zinc finger protein 558 [Culex quinquefasciatus]|eukprot:XP_001842702.1 zinc finger protein 558 [Culex quinquefasciatus]